jgi:hypothetical protein
VYSWVQRTHSLPVQYSTSLVITSALQFLSWHKWRQIPLTFYKGMASFALVYASKHWTVNRSKIKTKSAEMRFLSSVAGYTLLDKKRTGRGKSEAIPVTGLGGTIRLRDVEAPTFSTKSAHRWRWGCQPHAPAALYPQQVSWYSFPLEAESTPGP